MSKSFDYDAILKEISIVKESIEKRKVAIASINIVRSLYSLILYGVLLFTIYPLAYYFIELNFSKFSNSPAYLQLTFWVSFIFLFIAMGVTKLIILKKEMIKKKYDLIVFINKTFTNSTLCFFIPILI